MENRLIEEQLKDCKDKYEGINMSDANFEAYKAKIEQAKRDKRRMKKKTSVRIWGAAAAAAALLVLVPNVSSTAAYAMGNIPLLGNLIHIVTFRDYSYEDANNSADVKVPEVVVDTKELTNLSTKENVIKSSANINEQIAEITDKLIEDFKKNKEEGGKHDLQISSEVVRTTCSYFTLKLICSEFSASSHEEYHFYTIDLNTGKELKLADLFWDNTDYIACISEDIKSQMREQMESDENVSYFIDTDMPEEDFKQISEDTDFYINEHGQLVISFNEATVAPASMGQVEFVEDFDALNNMKRPSTGVLASGEEYDSYEELINRLGDGMWYAQINLDSAKHPIMLVTEMTYDYDGTMAAMDADVYAYNEHGKIVKYGMIASCGTAYPLSKSQDCLYTAGNHHVSKMFVGEQYSAMITLSEAVETFDTDANAYYYYYSLDDEFAGAVEDNTRLVAMFEEFEGVDIIGFTQK